MIHIAGDSARSVSKITWIPVGGDVVVVVVVALECERTMAQFAFAQVKQTAG